MTGTEVAGGTEPGWLSEPAEPGECARFEFPVRSLGAAIPVRTWAPARTKDDEALPLLVVHDGPEYDSRASLTQYLAAGVAGGRLPRLRAALLGPGPRDRWYSASARYARALALTVVPELAGRVATTTTIGMGTSLGALAMLHAHCRYPGLVEAMFLQSGSYFWPAYDSHERRFRYYPRVVAFVTAVHADPGRPVPVVLTCGAAEENLANNRLMTATLTAGGYPATLHEVAGGHDFTAWRDALDPHLTGLLRRAGR
ncbi:MAG TPA: alpha/beta hydrolase-fold protein [Streptosporangiaceae bacterium]|nr:alpha/beta hydrolase-fold protein [Streptosporangiaceae bacterium]